MVLGLAYSGVVFQAYLVTCTSSGKKYVGVTSGSIERRWKWHVTDSRRRVGSALWAAIRKHGEFVFTIESIASSMTLAGILDAERMLIAQHGTFAPNGYNLTLGGEGRFGYRPSPESVERSAAKHRGRPCHPNTRAAASCFHLGRAKSAEHRARISAAKIGRPRTEATKAKISVYWLARRERGDFKTGRAYEHHAK